MSKESGVLVGGVMKSSMANISVKQNDEDIEKNILLGQKLCEELKDACHELEEFGLVKLERIDTEKQEVTLTFAYDDPEKPGDYTLFCMY